MENFLAKRAIKSGLVLLSSVAGSALENQSVRAAPLSSIQLVPFRDPWQAARPRFQDIANRTFDAWIDPVLRRSNGKFQYTARQVTLLYDKNPSGAQFVGRIEARGLKPNFCYQMKLVGKPVDGVRGWGTGGDDAANERLGRLGRWWDDQSSSSSTNVSDADFQDDYLGRPAEQRRTIYGYIYLGAFVTDKNGNYRGEVKGSNSYHVTWQSWQISMASAADMDKNRYQSAGNWTLADTGGYGYGPSQLPIKLLYEYESGRPQPIVLPPGNYNCRFLLTEESFHNSMTATPEGGSWQSVLTNEDFSIDTNGNLVPDRNPVNDVSFTVKADAPIN